MCAGGKIVGEDLNVRFLVVILIEELAFRAYVSSESLIVWDRTYLGKYPQHY